ncbi:hypothetical protein ZOSMA_313G00110 [Zostera marina]|uniref:Uncharacterized protein n=1 Tax=Zostera marina TaxID=29655 RepID=A0A0K9P9M8_ZOSMR|nr:hypothetical protein ZOSMA_313G00110 [Zostera marina]
MIDQTVIKLWSQRSSGSTPWWSYWSASISNTIGPTMGIEALKHISYPAQVGHTKGYVQVLVIAPEILLGTRTTVKITSVGR